MLIIALFLLFFSTDSSANTLVQTLGDYSTALAHLTSILSTANKPAKPSNGFQESVIANPYKDDPLTVTQWIAQCYTLPTYKNTEGSDVPRAPSLTDKVMQTVLDNAVKFYTDMLKAEQTKWVNWAAYDQSTNVVKPYAQRLIVTSGDRLIMHGDLHGDIHSVCAFLQQLKDEGIIDDKFKIQAKKTYLLFLGDYVDRGKHGAEVLYTILRLKMANPERCILVRGNHETQYINKKFGFGFEVNSKYNNNVQDILKAASTFYEKLPVVLFIDKKENNECIQCCHGGIEIEYIPDNLLTSDKKYEYISSFDLANNRESILKMMKDKYSNTFNQIIDQKIESLPRYETIMFKDVLAEDIGFLWNCFFVRDSENSLQHDSSRNAWSFPKNITEIWCDIPQKKIVGIFRAHQHSDPEMIQQLVSKDRTHGAARLWQPSNWPDVTKLWNGIVVTFNICPSTQNLQEKSDYKDKDAYYDTYGMLTVGNGTFAETWRLDVFNKKMFDAKWNLVTGVDNKYVKGLDTQKSDEIEKEAYKSGPSKIFFKIVNDTQEGFILRSSSYGGYVAPGSSFIGMLFNNGKHNYLTMTFDNKKDRPIHYFPSEHHQYALIKITQNSGGSIQIKETNFDTREVWEK